MGFKLNKKFRIDWTSDLFFFFFPFFWWDWSSDLLLYIEESPIMINSTLLGLVDRYFNLIEA